MNFAVIKYAGKQHLVTEGQTLEVEGRMAEGPGELELSEVLLLSLDDKLQIGTPLVSGVKIPAKIVEVGKGEKIDIYKFKAKSRYRKHTGFRPYVTTLEIGNFGGSKVAVQPQQTAAKKTTPKPKK